MSELPPFPVDFDSLPTAYKYAISRKVLAKQRTIHDNMADLLKWIYLGSTRPDGKEVSYGVSGRDCWAMLHSDVEAEGNAHRSGT